MTALTRVTRGENPANSDRLNQIIDAWNGNTAGVNQGNGPMSLTAINDSINYAVAIRNADAAGKGLVVYAPDGVTPLLRADKTNGVYASPDGITAAAPIATTTGTQTFTNKTLTSPHFTSPVVDSGGLTVTAGGVTVTAGGVGIGAAVSGGFALLNTGTSWFQNRLAIGASNIGAGGAVGLPNAAAGAINWRNGANTGDDALTFSSADQLSLTCAAVVATAGAAVSDLLVTINGTGYRIRLYQ